MGKQQRMEFSVQAIADLVIRDALYLRRFEDPIFRLPRSVLPAAFHLRCCHGHEPEFEPVTVPVLARRSTCHSAKWFVIQMKQRRPSVPLTVARGHLVCRLLGHASITSGRLHLVDVLVSVRSMCRIRTVRPTGRMEEISVWVSGYRYGCMSVRVLACCAWPLNVLAISPSVLVPATRRVQRV